MNKPLLLVLLLGAMALVLKAPFVGEEHRFELAMGLVGVAGALSIACGSGLRIGGLLSVEPERRVLAIVLGVVLVVVAGLGLRRASELNRDIATARPAVTAVVPVP